jgi:zinc D-Ala-D-Ala carboxypeptidase
MDRISHHISYAEGVKSAEAIRLGLNNEPSAEQLAAMRLVATTCFEPLRKHHGKPIGISSFFRSAHVNKAIGGSRTSQHMAGEAIDIDADTFNNGITNADIFHWLRANVPFDQLIWEFGTDAQPAWVHISYRALNNRGQVLRAQRVKRNGRLTTIYTPLP